MSTTVIDALQNAQINLRTFARIGGVEHPVFIIAMEQLNNGIEALENGKHPDDVIQADLLSDVDTGKP